MYSRGSLFAGFWQLSVGVKLKIDNMPTPQQMIDVIRERCITANPEIVELKFGCEIENLRGVRGKVLEVQKYENESDCVDYWTNGSGVREPTTYLTIIGRPVRLADVLLAMRKTTEGYRYVVAALYGMFIYQDENVGTYTAGEPRWDFYHDDLSKQSERMISFIYDLVK